MNALSNGTCSYVEDLLCPQGETDANTDMPGADMGEGRAPDKREGTDPQSHSHAGSLYPLSLLPRGSLGVQGKDWVQGTLSGEGRGCHCKKAKSPT